LFSKVYFPRLIVPLSALVSNIFAFGIQFATFVCFYGYFKAAGNESFGMNWHAVLLPLIIVQIALLSLGVGLLMSALTAKYRI